MPSPFPGMNPYLEQEDAWQDFHQRFATTAAEALSPQVSPAYIVKVEEHLYVHEQPTESRHLLGRADVSVSRTPGASVGAPAPGVLTVPTHVQLPRVDVERQAYLEIRDRQGRQLVTVIELLSPSNKKSGEDRTMYVGRRTELLRGPVHFVEVDLLRGWERMPFVDLPPCDYYALVSRATDRPRADVWPVRLRDRLPVIPIPLTPPHSDAQLDLQAILDRIYDAAYYADYIYAGSPRPPLTEVDAAWAQQYAPGERGA